MKKYLTLFVLVLWGIIAKAQTTISTSSKRMVDTNAIYTAVEKVATFPGGLDKFYKYLRKNSKYAIDTDHDGPVQYVFLTFVVERDGSLTDVKIMRGASPELDAEAIRLIKASAPWVPGEQSGYKVRLQYTVPVSFAAN